MPYCGPRNTVPACEALPSVGFGSDSCGFGSGFGYGGSALGLGNFGGDSVPAANLGVLRGVQPACITQLRPQELTVLPAPFNVIIPGPILSASPQRTKVGGYTPCADSGRSFSSGGFSSGGFGSGVFGSGGFGYGGICSQDSGFGGLGGGSYGSGNVFNRRSSVCR